MGFRSALHLAHNEQNITGVTELSFEDTPSLPWTVTEVAGTLKVSCDIAPLSPSGIPVPPGSGAAVMYQLIDFDTSSGTLEPIPAASMPRAIIENYDTWYAKGYRLYLKLKVTISQGSGQFFVSPANMLNYVSDAPLITPQTVETDWTLCDIASAPTAAIVPTANHGGFGTHVIWSDAVLSIAWSNSDGTFNSPDASNFLSSVNGVDSASDEVLFADGAGHAEWRTVKAPDVDSQAAAAGTVLTADGAGSSSFLASGGANVGGCGVRRNQDTSIPNNVETAIVFNGESWDTDGYHTGTSDTVTIPVGKGGKYLLQWSVSFAANATGIRAAYPSFLSGMALFDELARASGATTVSGSVIASLADGNTVKLLAKQTSGAALTANSYGGSIIVPFLRLARLGD